MKHLSLIAGVLVGLSGCSSPTDPAVQAKINAIQNSMPTCSSEKECNAKWETAQLWVVKNTGYKIQTFTSVLIETYNARDSSTALAAQITKEPLGGGRYQFNAKLWCDNWVWGCRPNRLDAMLDFNRRLNAVQP